MGVFGSCGNILEEKEVKLPGTPDSITFEGLAVINEQKENNVFKIVKENNVTGTGFLCLIPFPDKLHPLPVLFTCNHVLNSDDIKPGKEIKMIFNDKIEKILKIDDSRMTYTSEKNEFDTTIIEIRNEDNFDINNMLEIDNNIYKDDLNHFYKNKTIYIIHYPNGLNSSYSSNILKNIDIENVKLWHLCESHDGSSGSPIFNLQNFNVIGIHVGKDEKKKINMGIVLKPIIDNFYNLQFNSAKKNEIIITINIDKEQINKEIYFLDKPEKEKKNNLNEHLSELNESNVKIFINDEEYKYCKYFVPKKEGTFIIKLVFGIEMKDCSYMFNECVYIDKIDLSSFNSKNVTDMSFMFYNCCHLKNINFTKFQTQNVTNMSKMFYGCKFLINLNLIYFDTKNVIDMSYMFGFCENLISLDLSSFDTNKVTNMEGLFILCHNLNFLDVSSFDTENVVNMKYMFCLLDNLRKLDLSSFNTEKVTNMSQMFKSSRNLTEINFSSFNTKNVEDMSSMFEGCRDLIFLELESFNTEKVKYMNSMFESCKHLQALDLSNFNTKNVITMTKMFYNCNNLLGVNVSSFNIENTEYLDGMFCDCSNLMFLNLSNFRLDKKVADGMLYGCNLLKTFIFNESILNNLECLLKPIGIFSQSSPYFSKNFVMEFS